MQESILETEKIPKLFIKYVIPSMIAMVIMGVQGMIDGLFLGNYVGSNAMASVNIAMPFIYGASAINFVISVGATAFIGRLLGEKNATDAKTVFKTALISLTSCSTFLMIFGTLFSTQIASSLGADASLLQNSSVYIKIVSLSFVTQSLYILFSFINRVTAKTYLFVIATTAGIICNVTLNYIFLVKFNMGITGAAIATAISNSIGFFINIPPMLSKKSQLNIYDGNFSNDFLKKMIFNGASEGVTSISTSITTLIFNLTFMHYYGPIGVSAFTIISYISQLGTLMIFGIADSASPIISVNFGAKKQQRVKELIKLSVLTSFAIGIMLYLIIFFKGEMLIGFFADQDLNLIQMTYNGARLYGLMFFMCGINMISSAYFTAVGNAVKSMLISASRGLIFILIGVLVLPSLFGVTGVWLVAPFADLITLFIVIFMFRYNKTDA